MTEWDDTEDLEEMATFCVAFPGMTPAAYWALTGDEHDALIRAYNKAHKNS